MKHADSLSPAPQHRGDGFAQSKLENVDLPASPRATLAAPAEPRKETLVDTVRAIALKDAEISVGVLRKWLGEEQL